LNTFLLLIQHISSSITMHYLLYCFIFISLLYEWFLQNRTTPLPHTLAEQLYKMAYKARKLGHSVLVSGLCSVLISMSMHVGLQVSTCSSYDLCHPNTKTNRHVDIHRDRQLMTVYTISSAIHKIFRYFLLTAVSSANRFFATRAKLVSMFFLDFVNKSSLMSTSVTSCLVWAAT